MTNEHKGTATLDRVGVAIADALNKYGDADIQAGVGWLMQDDDVTFIHAIASAAIGAMHPAETRQLAQSYLDRRDEDWTWVDPEDIKRLARAVLGMADE